MFPLNLGPQKCNQTHQVPLGHIYRHTLGTSKLVGRFFDRKTVVWQAKTRFFSDHRVTWCNKYALIPLFMLNPVISVFSCRSHWYQGVETPDSVGTDIRRNGYPSARARISAYPWMDCFLVFHFFHGNIWAATDKTGHQWRLRSCTRVVALPDLEGPLLFRLISWATNTASNRHQSWEHHLRHCLQQVKQVLSTLMPVWRRFCRSRKQHPKLGSL